LPLIEAEAPARPTRIGLVVLVVLAGVAVLVYVADRVTKYFVTENLELGTTVPFIGEILQFRRVDNPGAAFSLGSGTTWVFAIIAAGAAIFIVIFARRIRSVAWAILFGLLLGGTLGNLTDRLTRPPGFGQGHVVDFLLLIYFPAIFNIADIAIVSSMVLFVILTVRGIRLDGHRARTPELAPTDSA
jgi:signal peptidase II